MVLNGSKLYEMSSGIKIKKKLPSGCQAVGLCPNSSLASVSWEFHLQTSVCDTFEMFQFAQLVAPWILYSF